ncbi:MAG: hypothetical protein LBM08_08105, partial [Dysgonamonadaceae bacterium]|nr:hypothetical protein [Dysgonamonadaceae bacterium]
GCEKEDGPKQGEFTDEQIERAYQEIKVSADSILLSEDPIVGFEGMAGEYRKLKEVKVVEVTDNGMFIELKNDQIVGWYVPELEKDILPSIGISGGKRSKDQTRNFDASGNKKTVCLINTISEEEGYDYVRVLMEALAIEFINQDWEVDIKEDTFVTVSFVKEHLNDYDALYFVSHGMEGLGKTWIITGDKVGDKISLSGGSRINVLKRGIKDGTLAISASEYYAFCADFITEYYQKDDFKNEFIYFSACTSTGAYGKTNLSLPNVFTEFGGASVYLGWHNENYSGAVSGMFFYLQLLKGNTIKQSFDFLENFTLQDWLSWMGGHGLKWEKDDEPNMLDWADLTIDNTKRQTSKPVASLDYYPKSAADVRLVEPPAVNPETGLTEDIEDLVPEDIIITMQDLGVPINGGNTPPIIEGTYKIQPLILKGTNIVNDFAIGHEFAPSYITFSQQNNGNLTLKADEKQGSSVSTGTGAFIVGEGNRFSVFINFTTTNTNINTISKVIEVYSGTILPSGIVGCVSALFMVDDGGDPYNQLIENGSGRVFWDADGFSEKVAPEQSAQKVFTKPGGVNLVTSSMRKK